MTFPFAAADRVRGSIEYEGDLAIRQADFNRHPHQYSPPFRPTARSASGETASERPSGSVIPAIALLSGGAVPGLKASRITCVSPGLARIPVFTLTRMSLMPAGTRNG